MVYTIISEKEALKITGADKIFKLGNSNLDELEEVGEEFYLWTDKKGNERLIRKEKNRGTSYKKMYEIKEYAESIGITMVIIQVKGKYHLEDITETTEQWYVR